MGRLFVVEEKLIDTETHCYVFLTVHEYPNMVGTYCKKLYTTDLYNEDRLVGSIPVKIDSLDGQLSSGVLLELTGGELVHIAWSLVSRDL